MWLFSRLNSYSLSELTRQIAPPTKNGRAAPPTESRKSSQSVNPPGVWDWWGSLCWITLSHRLRSWWCPSFNSLKFQLCNHPLVSQKPLALSSEELRQIACWHHLWLELRWYLIAFKPLTFVLDQRNILGKCFHFCLSCLSRNNPRIAPLTSQYECPCLLLLIIISGIPKTNKIEPRSYSIIPCTEYSGGCSFLFKHSNLFSVDPKK